MGCFGAVFGLLFVAPFVDMAWWQVKSFVDFSVHFFQTKLESQRGLPSQVGTLLGKTP